jgi:hypothetical protein
VLARSSCVSPSFSILFLLLSPGHLSSSFIYVLLFSSALRCCQITSWGLLPVKIYRRFPSQLALFSLLPPSHCKNFSPAGAVPAVAVLDAASQAQIGMQHALGQPKENTRTRDNWGGGYETDGKMHARNSFFTDFSMSSPLSTLKFPVSFFIYCILLFPC